MSLSRQLLIILCACISVFFLFKAGFLTIQSFLIVPSAQPLTALAETNEQFSPSEENLPIQITIPTISVSLPVLPSTIIDSEWETTTKGVSLLQNMPGEDHKGYVMYGHNWNSLLGKLHKTTIGDELRVNFANGSSQKFRVVSIFRVNPKEVDILELSKPTTLMLYTCIGFLDSQRLVVLAELDTTSH